MTSTRKLWWGSGSPYAWSVMMLLEEKGLDYESKLIEFSKKEHKTEEFLKMNPRGKVPVFEDGDFIIYESSAIIDYIENSYPEPPLFPKDKKVRALAMTRVSEVSYLATLVHALYNSGEDKKEELLKNFKEELQRWESYLQGKKYLAGESFSVADIIFYPNLSLYERFGLNLDLFPNLSKYLKLVSERESAKKSHPPHWKNGPAPSTPLAVLK